MKIVEQKKLTFDSLRGMVRFCWDISTQTKLRKFHIGGFDTFRDSPISICRFENELCIAMRLSPGHEFRQTLEIRMAEGDRLAVHGGSHMVNNAMDLGFPILQNDGYLCKWDCKTATPNRVGRLEGDLPALNIVKAIAR